MYGTHKCSVCGKIVNVKKMAEDDHWVFVTVNHDHPTDKGKLCEGSGEYLPEKKTETKGSE